MTQPVDAYEKLRRRLDTLPIPYPETESGVELRLLRHLFTAEEANVAGELGVSPESLERIRRRLEKRGIRHTSSELKNMFDGLQEKGAITGSIVKAGKKMVRGYSLMPLAVGMFEMQVDRLTADYAKDFEEYLGSDFGEAVVTTGTGQLRTVPVGRAIESVRDVGLYDNIRSYVGSVRGPFAVMNCVCRQAKDLLEEPCDHGDVRETCLSIGPTAVGMSRRGNARLVEREEFLDILDRAEKRGFVIQPENTQTPSFICCCCGDCCEILGTAKKLQRPSEVFHSNYYARVDEALCNGCTRCVSRCQMDAIHMDAGPRGDVAVIDRYRCIGCGLCVSTCPTTSLSLVQKEKPKLPPKTKTAMFSRIYSERLGFLKASLVLAKILLRRKV